VQPDDLYGLPLERFVPERAALTKELRSAGRRDEAADVAKLRKPSAAAWAVNQLVRTQRDATRELFAAGDAVRAAQADVLAGRGDARALRDAGARERDAVGGLVETARGLLGTDGHDLSATTLERIADTLHAAALDDDARDEVREGRLERELRHVGLGLGEAPAAGLAAGRREAGTAPAPAQGRAKEPGAGAGAGTQERASQLRAAKERAGAEAAQAAERVAARRAARAAVAKAAKAEERAGHALRAAEERRDRAATALAQADAARDEARAAAAAAADEHRRARAALEED
jgi:hypothetical protein